MTALEVQALADWRLLAFHLTGIWAIALLWVFTWGDVKTVWWAGTWEGRWLIAWRDSSKTIRRLENLLPLPDLSEWELYGHHIEPPYPTRRPTQLVVRFEGETRVRFNFFSDEETPHRETD